MILLAIGVGVCYNLEHLNNTKRGALWKLKSWEYAP